MGGFSNGVYTRFFNWVNDANSSININAPRCDTEDNGFAAGLSTCILKDGTQTVTANIPFAGFNIQNIGDAVLAKDAVNLETMQSGASLVGSSVSGTNTITFNLTPAISAYSTGQTYRFVAAGSNTGAVTVNINGVGAKNILKKTLSGLVACTTGDIISGLEYDVFYDGTQFQINPTPGLVVLNPFSDASPLVKNSTDATKQITLSAASVTTGNTRTLTAQDKSYTIADNADLALKANIASPTLTGTPAAPTASVGTNTTQIATTAFLYSVFSGTAADPGTITIPISSGSSIIIKWGTGPTVGNNLHSTVTFATAFPNNCWVVASSSYFSSPDTSDAIMTTDSITTSGFGVTGNTSGTSPTLKWVAIGN